MAQDRIQMPSGMGGLVRYFEDVENKYAIKPGHVILLALFIMVVMILLYRFGNSWIGL